MNVRLLENRTPFWVTEMRRDRKTASGEISKRGRGRTEREKEREGLFICLLI